MKTHANEALSRKRRFFTNGVANASSAVLATPTIEL